MRIKNLIFQNAISLLTMALVLIFISASCSTNVYLDPKAPVTKRVDDLLKKMTLDEKIGQMMQSERGNKKIDSLLQYSFLGSVLSGGGSVPDQNNPQGWVNMYNGLQKAALSTRLKIPMIYGIDAVHGNNNVYGTTLFPHNIGLGCTRDTLLVRKCAGITAMEVRATGLNWTFSPCIAVPRDIRWGRTYEGFGETPELQAMMAGAAVKGYQGETLGTPYHILACAKHYIGDGGTTGGKDQGNTEVSEEALRKIFLPGYIKAIESGVGSIMASFNSWNGLKCHASKFLITDLLKGELKFDGFVVSDWEAVRQCAPDFKEAIKLSVNAGVDMFMEPTRAKEFMILLKQLVKEGAVPESRIDDAVRRILSVKFRMGLFENPFASMALADSLGNDYHRKIARQAVRESLVLLKNKKDILPLSKSKGKILVAGSKSNDLGSQCGGWTITWQGNTGTTTKGTTILEALKNARGPENIIFSADGKTKVRSDIAVVVVGETPYAEGMGDNQELTLKPEDLKVIYNVKKLGVPYVVLLLSGRPLILDKAVTDANALVACWLPGTEGSGVTDVLFGDYNFTGKLSHTWPATISQVPLNYGDAVYSPLFPYGYGLNYNK
jgi:beta-glucosidase